MVIGRDGWLYFLGEDGKSLDRDYRGVLPIRRTSLAIAAEFKRRHDFLAALGIAYVVMVVPDKATIYPEHLPRWVTRVAPQTRLDRFYAALAAYPDVTVLDLRPALTAAKARERNYFKTDSHWNLLGATIGYEALAACSRRRCRGFPPCRPSPPYIAGVDVYSGDLAKMMGCQRLARTTSRRSPGAGRCQPALREARRGAAVPPGADGGTLVYACDRPDCRPPSFTATRWRFRCCRCSPRIFAASSTSRTGASIARSSSASGPPSSSRSSSSAACTRQARSRC